MENAPPEQREAFAFSQVRILLTPPAHATYRIVVVSVMTAVG